MKDRELSARLGALLRELRKDRGLSQRAAAELAGAPQPKLSLLEAGRLDFGALVESASAMQAQLLAAQEEAAKAVVEGVAGGGVVRVEVTGGFEFRSVTIDPSAVDPDDVEMLQDLVLAALRHAVDQIGESQASAVDLGGLGLGGVDLGGLFGN